MAEKFRYVDVPEHSAIIADLANSSANISAELEIAKEAANLHIEKHQHMRQAEELIRIYENNDFNSFQTKIGVEGVKEV
jgi:hypothetical protein